MQSELRSRLRLLPRLGETAIEVLNCKICGEPSSFFDVVDFNKCCAVDFYCFRPAQVVVNYYRCSVCGFIFTNFFDDWSPADFSEFVYNADYAIVDPDYTGARSIIAAVEMAKLLKGCEAARILDYGSGAGQFSLEMKARGFDHVTGYDPFSAPHRPSDRFDIVIAIEVIEHSVDPVGTLRDMNAFLKEGGGILLTQLLQPPNIESLRANWWYAGPRNGHASLFADNSFCALGRQVRMTFHRGAGTLHGFVRSTPSHAVEAVFERIGPAFHYSVELHAPVGPHAAWHETEGAPPLTRFRWTRTPEVLWPPQPCLPGRVKLRIPLILEIVDNFAASCRLFAGDTEWPIEIGTGEIVANIQCPSTTTGTIRLLTPEPLSPRTLRGAEDYRTLGLAIPIAEG